MGSTSIMERAPATDAHNTKGTTRAATPPAPFFCKLSIRTACPEDTAARGQHGIRACPQRDGISEPTDDGGTAKVMESFAQTGCTAGHKMDTLRRQQICGLNVSHSESRGLGGVASVIAFYYAREQHGYGCLP